MDPVWHEDARTAFVFAISTLVLAHWWWWTTHASYWFCNPRHDVRCFRDIIREAVYVGIAGLATAEENEQATRSAVSPRGSCAQALYSGGARLESLSLTVRHLQPSDVAGVLIEDASPSGETLFWLDEVATADLRTVLSVALLEEIDDDGKCLLNDLLTPVQDAKSRDSRESESSSGSATGAAAAPPAPASLTAELGAATALAAELVRVFDTHYARFTELLHYRDGDGEAQPPFPLRAHLGSSALALEIRRRGAPSRLALLDAVVDNAMRRGNTTSSAERKAASTRCESAPAPAPAAAPTPSASPAPAPAIAHTHLGNHMWAVLSLAGGERKPCRIVLLPGRFGLGGLEVVAHRVVDCSPVRPGRSEQGNNLSVA